MLPILALFAFILGVILVATPVKEPWKEIGKACLWCGLLVILLSSASWHAIPLH